MSAGGHITDMVNRIRQNAALKISRRNKFKGANRAGIFSKKEHPKPEYDFPEVSKPELERIKMKIREGASKENRKQQAYLMLFALVVIIIFFIFNYY